MALCHDRSHIYAIGGDKSGTKNATKDSEAYNVAEDKWDPLPDLNDARFYAVALIFNQKWLYTMIGCDMSKGNLSQIDTIERMDISEGIGNALHWERIKIEGIVTGSMYEIAQISSKEVLLFGSGLCHC